MDEQQLNWLRQIDFDVDKVIKRNTQKCVLCGKCVTACNKQNVNAITKPSKPIEIGANKSPCVGCGQCILVCPLKALYEKTNIRDVIKYLKDDSVKTIALVAPSIRVSLGEEFGLPVGTDVEGKMVTALKKCGFDYVYDVDCGADFTIMEEARELLDRLDKHSEIPLFSSCCPSWTKYMKDNYPLLADNLSTCKSPNECLGSLIRFTHDGDIKLVSIMPCVSKKNEIAKDKTIDLCMTTRELANLIRKRKVDFANLEPTEFDMPFGEDSGAGLIFGSTGGVSEAMLRYVLKTKNQDIAKAEVVRHSDNVKVVNLSVDDITLSLCIVNGLGHVDQVMQSIISGESHYDFVEVMACEGGCVGGGGQPFVKPGTCVGDVIQKRREALFAKDSSMTVKTCADNKTVQDVYKNILSDKNLIEDLLHNKK